MWQTIDSHLADEFVQQYSHSELLESTAWLELQKRFYQVERLGYFFQERLVAVATFIRHPITAGYGYYYSPRGPIFINDRTALAFWPAMLAEIKPWLIKRKALFWRLEPVKQPDNLDFKRLGLRRSADIQPSQSIILNIGLTEAEILQQMHPKTRYNIRLAAKQAVTIEDVGIAGLADFWRLMKTTGQRDSFRLHSRKYYQAIIQSPFSRLLLAKRSGQVLAAGIFAYWGETAAYLHGASDNQQRELMATYLIQWQAIQLGRQDGCQRYDLCGISQTKWPGVTRFKKGFGGSVINYPGTFDWPINIFSYRLYTLARQLRRIFR